MHNATKLESVQLKLKCCNSRLPLVIIEPFIVMVSLKNGWRMSFLADFSCKHICISREIYIGKSACFSLLAATDTTRFVPDSSCSTNCPRTWSLTSCPGCSLLISEIRIFFRANKRKREKREKHETHVSSSAEPRFSGAATYCCSCCYSDCSPSASPPWRQLPRRFVYPAAIYRFLTLLLLLDNARYVSGGDNSSTLLSSSIYLRRRRSTISSWVRVDLSRSRS